MKSPFAGMDPYLEQHWRGVHQNLITFAQGDLNEQLPGALRARVEERVYVETATEESRALYPDIHVVKRNGAEGAVGTAPSGAAVALAEPVLVETGDEPVTEGYLEIRDSNGQRVVTMIEFVSPSNKLPGHGRGLYVQKQQECLSAAVNLVEIDLVRTGPWVLAVRPQRIPSSHRTAYQVCIRRASRPFVSEVYAVPLRQRLPLIPIPLREEDKDVTLDLQSLIERCYRQGRYDDINYQVEPVPPLSPDDAVWADHLLKEAGKR